VEERVAKHEAQLKKPVAFQGCQGAQQMNNIDSIIQLDSPKINNGGAQEEIN
jgi:hypothetical protein